MMNADDEVLQLALDRARFRGLVLRELTPLSGGATARCWIASQSSTGRVVLKIQAGLGDYCTVTQTMETVRALPSGLLPLARPLDYGPLPGFGWYAVTEMLPGHRANFLTSARVTQILSFNRRQTRRRPALGVDWVARLSNALDPDGRVWTKLAAVSRHGQALRDLAFADPPEPLDLRSDDLVLGDLNLRNVLFDATGAVCGLVDVETTLGFGCRSMDLAPLLVDWHRADVRSRVNPQALPPDPAVADLLRAEIGSIGGPALLASVVIHRLAEGANWAVEHGLQAQLPFWHRAARDALRAYERGQRGTQAPRHSAGALTAIETQGTVMQTDRLSASRALRCVRSGATPAGEHIEAAD